MGRQARPIFALEISLTASAMLSRSAAGRLVASGSSNGPKGFAGVQAVEFTEKLFASGSVLTSLPAAQALNLDCKEFQSDGRLFSVAQIEELGFDQFWRRKDELIDTVAELEAQKESGAISDKKYKQDLKDLKFQLSKVLEKLGTKRDGG